MTVKGLPKGFSRKEGEVGGEDDEYDGIEEGLNDWNVHMWRGPKMPNYGDRFEFRLYALDNDRRFDNQVPELRWCYTKFLVVFNNLKKYFKNRSNCCI